MDLPVYLNKFLIQDLYSILINGYLESTSFKYTIDKTDTLKLQKATKNQHTKDDTYSKKRNRYHCNENNFCTKDKEKNLIRGDCFLNEWDYLGIFNDQSSNTRELSITKLYTTFYLFCNLRNMMMGKNMIKVINNEDIENNNVRYGEYVQFTANINNSSLPSQINTLINTIECYDIEKLNSLIEKKDISKDSSFNNYGTMIQQLKNLEKCLDTNNTIDMIVNFKKCSGVLCVNKNNFLENNINMYDISDCNCTVLGKVIKVIDKEDRIDLLRKTCLTEYYNKFLKSIKPYLNILYESNIILLEDIITEISGPSIQVIPIAIYV